MPAGIATISVTYDREYAITVDSNSSEYVQIEKQNAIAGESVEFTVSDREGYRITEVKYNETTLQSESNTYSFSMPAEDVTIAVTYSELFDIKVSSDHGKVTIAENKTEAIENESVSFTIQPSENYRIASVSINGGAVEYTTDESTYSFSMPAGDVTISVTYDREYAITVDSNSSGYIQIDKQNAIAGESVEFTVSDRAGYRITEVKYNNTTLQSESNTYSFSMPAEGVTISVTYAELFDISVSSDHGTVIIGESKTEAIENESVSFTIDPSENYRIESISINSGSVEYTQEGDTYSFTMPAGLVIIAVTYDREYAITVDSNSSEYVQIEKQNAIAGENVEFTVSERTGYRITEVKYNNTTLQSESNTYSFNMPAGDVTISVTYDREYAITVDSNLSGYVQIDKQNAIAGESVEFTVSERTGYRITEVKYNDTTLQSESNTYSFDMPAGDVTISVTYVREYAVAIDSSSGMVTGVNVSTAINGEQISISTNGLVTDEIAILISRLYYIESGSEDRVTINQTDGQYSFTMPANNVTIYAESQTYRRLDDFTFSRNSITDYTGSASQLTLPAYYDTVTVNSQDYTVERNTGRQITSIGDRAFQYCTSLTSITIPERVTSIGTWAFLGCSSLTSITIPEGVTSIGDAVFSGCSNLTSITIPKGVTRIGNSAFRDCTSLTSITIPEGVTSIGSSAFSSCSNLTSITIPEGVTSIGSSAFSDCTSLTSITIPEGVTSIDAFYNCTSLTEITLPNSLTSIGGSAFQNCTSLTEITLPNSLTSIGDRAFSYCTSLTSITLPNSLTSIEIYAFQYCRSLTSITIPAGVTSIGDEAFYYCTSLTSITLPNSLTSIGSMVFSGCFALAIVYNNSNLEIVAGATTYGGVAQYAKEVVENGGVAQGRILAIEDINYYINSNTGDFIALAPSTVRDEITSATLIEGTTEINQHAFQSCSSLTEITIPEGVISIGNYAFLGCDALAIVYNNSSLEITAGATTYGGVAQYAKEVVKNGEVAQGRIETYNNVKYYINDVTNEKVALYMIDKNATTVTLAEDTTEIQGWAFDGCTGLTSITIPEGVTSIGNSAFRDCTSLIEITLPNSLTSIGLQAFYNCRSLTSITIPEGVTSIGSNAFQICTSLTEITIESDDIYIDATGTKYNHAGYLLQKATTVRVLTTIVNTYDNDYLENTSNFSTSPDDKYTVFTKL